MIALLPTRVGTSSSWRSVCLMVAIAASVLPASLISVLAPAIEKSFAFGPAMVGEVTALLYACSAMAAIASGWAADRLGGRGVLVGSMAGLVASLLAIGLVHNHSLLICSVILGGSCSGAIPPASYRLLWDHVAAVRQGSAFGVIQSGFPGAVVFAGLVAPGVAGDLGWRAVFFGTAVVTAIVGYGAYRFFAAPADADPVGSGPVMPARAPGSRASRGALALFGTASLLGNAGAGVLITYFVIYRVSRHESNALAGYYFALGGLAAVAARLALGRWVDRHRTRAGAMTVALLAGGAVGVALVSVPVGWLVAPATILSFGLGWGWSGLMGLTVTQVFAGTPGLSTGLVITTAGSAGAAAGPAVASVFLGVDGYPLAWAFAALCSSGGAFTVWCVNRVLRH